MADISVNAVFPTAKFITTDDKGDLQEVVGVDATNAFGSIQGIRVESVDTGSNGNSIVFAISENNGASDSVSINGTDVTLSLKDSATNYFLNQVNLATSAIATIQGIEIEAVSTGATFNTVTFTIAENNNTADSISIVGDDITLDLEASASEYQLNQVNPAVQATASIQGIEIEADAIGSLGNGITFEILENNATADSISATGNTVSLDLQNGANTYQISDIQNIVAGAGTDVTDLVNITFSGSTTDFLTSADSVATSGGKDERAKCFKHTKFCIFRCNR